MRLIEQKTMWCDGVYGWELWIDSSECALPTIRMWRDGTLVKKLMFLVDGSVLEWPMSAVLAPPWPEFIQRQFAEAVEIARTMRKVVR